MNKKPISRTDCIYHLEQLLPELIERYEVNFLGLFGSVARNEMRRYSDVDILVSFNKTPSLFTLINVERRIKKELGSKVDLIMKDAINFDFFEGIKNDLIQIN